MMKMFAGISTLSAVLFAVPAVGGAQDEEGIVAALDETARVLRELAGIDEALSNGDSSAIPRVLDLTEVPHLAPQEADATLDRLRRQVGQLRQDVDELVARRSGGTTGTPAGPGMGEVQAPFPDLVDDTNRAEPGKPTTGLDDEMRAKLAEQKPPTAETPRAGSAEGPSKTAFEGEGYVADAMKQANLYYRSARYDEALALFEQKPDDLDARYWAARCLEKLERYDEALLVYEAVAATEDGGSVAQRAHRDAEFLSWKIEYVSTQGRKDDQ